MRIETQAQIWRKVNARKSEILKGMGIDPNTEIKKVVIFKNIEAKRTAGSMSDKEDDENMVDKRLMKENADMKDENARLRTENSLL